MDMPIAKSLAISCDVTGYPVPKYRYIKILIFPRNSLYLYIIEPSGQTAPKIAGDGLNKQTSIYMKTVPLICDAQSYPTPKKR